MITRKFIYDLHREHEGTLSRHARLSANVLSQLSKELDKHPLPYRLDYSSPYHMLIRCNRWFSANVSGFSKRIDLIPLKESGEPYNAKYERSFMMPEGLVNYILKKYGKPIREDKS